MLVELLRFAGDIFVLYEVLCDKCYFIPPSLLAPEKVRVILDCGANIGITSLFFAARHPNARIYSIEPDPNNFVLLERNTRQEPRISPICGAIVGRACEQSLFDDRRSSLGQFNYTEQDGGRGKSLDD